MSRDSDGGSCNVSLRCQAVRNPSASHTLQKQTAPLRGLVRKLHGKKETDSQTALGGFPPGMASRAHRGRQEACVGGPHMEATFAAVRRETKSKRSMREDSCPEHQWEKMQLDPLKGKKQKEGPVKFSGDSDQKQGYANQPLSRSKGSQQQQPQQKPPVW